MKALLISAAITLSVVMVDAGPAPAIRIERVIDQPIITPSLLPGDDGDSINGPSLLRVPPWVRNPLGKYYLYFSHHAGKYIRLAYADRIEGPWKIHAAGALRMEQQTVLNGHIASPEVIVDEKSRRILLYYHGRPLTLQKKDIVGRDPEAGQKTSVAYSSDGLNFTPTNLIVGPAYLRVFQHGSRWFALNHSGELRVSDDPLQPFTPLTTIIGPEVASAIDPQQLGEPDAPTDRPANGPDRYSLRHIGLDLTGDWLFVYFTCVGHRPERILCTAVELKGPSASWKALRPVEVIRPATSAEGADLPLAYSKGGRSRAPENALRDPAVFREAGHAWLLYSTAGEHGLAAAKLHYAVTP